MRALTGTHYNWYNVLRVSSGSAVRFWMDLISVVATGYSPRFRELYCGSVGLLSLTSALITGVDAPAWRAFWVILCLPFLKARRWASRRRWTASAGSPRYSGVTSINKHTQFEHNCGSLVPIASVNIVRFAVGVSQSSCF